MRSLLDGIDRLSLWGARLACWLIAAMLALILAEVLSRKLFDVSLEFAWEYASYLLAISFLAGSGYVLRAGFHVRVQLALNALAPGRARLLDGIATAFTALVAGFFAYALVRLAYVSYVDQTRSFLPSNSLLWPFQALFALGAVVLALQFAARLVRVILNEPAELGTADAPLISTE
ncbi:hypothetical protein CDO44_09025 [Pigmentiphaga sp. NML080357]|uniref:TRAP transporter small permease subunit n=1 Tax=Pigmentiphaga sp. NML080357 TaxID=2008675 RepID=UPI000B417FB0|nr:TRAP transporter small permease [Pigmentiphaga sp. NML080357]OVZ60237.1 hypothetical protein CDO44_09025 [Pigmentiphaga sp. NML080357]